jgi:hypothetical protein
MHASMKFLLPAILLLLNFCYCTSQEKKSKEKTYQSALLQQDITQLEKALIELHSGVDRHVTLKEIHEGFEKARTKLDHDLTSFEFYALIAPLVASIQCGHTRIIPSEEIRAHFDSAVAFFPLPVKVLDNRIFANLKGESIIEIRQINNQSVEEILKKIYSSFPVDGRADGAKQEYVSEQFSHYYFMFVDHKPQHFDLSIVQTRTSQNKESITLQPVSASTLVMDDEETTIEFSMINGVGYLKVNTFSSSSYRRSGIGYEGFLKKTFSRLKSESVDKLVIDIRGNGGGDDQYGAMLFSYVAQEPFGYFKKVYRKEGNREIDVGHPCVQEQHPQADAFHGKVCLLINGRTFSTAADVASMFRSNKRAVIIGSETGGGYEGNTSGASERVELNNSHIKIQIPRWYYENVVVSAPQQHRGIIPDYAVKKEPADLFDRSNDPELDLALKILNE